MGVDFNAQPSPEGLLLAAQLRREQRERDQALEDRSIEVQVEDLAADQVHQDSAVDETQSQAEPEPEAADAIDQRAASAPHGSGSIEPDLVPDRDTRPSFAAQLEALASGSRPRRIDRQR